MAAGTMGSMLPLLLIAVALLGVALLVVPRVRRRRAGGRATTWHAGTVRAARMPAAAVAAPGGARTWGSAGTDEEEWDDDLGWEDAPAPAAPEREPDRGAGFTWPRREAPAEPAADAEPALAEPQEAAPAAGTDAPDVAPGAPAGTNGWTAGSAADDPAAPLELEDDDWLAPPPPVRAGFGAPGTAPAYAPQRGRQRKRLFSPVVLVGIYAVGGIGLVVLAVSLLSGSMGGGNAKEPAAPAPAAATSTPVPTPSATPVATPTPTPTPSPAELARREDAAASTLAGARSAAGRAERTARSAERKRIARQRAARARARAEARRRRAAAPPASSAPPTRPGDAGGARRDPDPRPERRRRPERL